MLPHAIPAELAVAEIAVDQMLYPASDGHARPQVGRPARCAACRPYRARAPRRRPLRTLTVGGGGARRLETAAYPISHHSGSRS